VSAPGGSGARSTLDVGGESYEIFRLDALQERYDVARLPYALNVLLENLLRNGEDERAEAWRGGPRQTSRHRRSPTGPRALMQDFTGVPAIVDLVALRDAMEELGGDATRINPLVPVELALIERHAGGAERVTEVALPIERALGVADQAGRHGGATNVDRTPFAQTLYERDELVEVSLESCAHRSCSDCQQLSCTAGDQRVNERVGEPSRTGSDRSCDARTLSSALARGSAPAESSSSSWLRLHRVRSRAQGREGSRAGRGGVSKSGSGNGPSGMTVSLVAVATIGRCGPCVPYGYDSGFLVLRGPHRPVWDERVTPRPSPLAAS
jgi:hypothetical protein